MSALDEVMTFKEATDYLGKSPSYLNNLNNLVNIGKLTEWVHYRQAGGGKLIMKVIVDKIKNGDDIMIKGKKWGKLDVSEKEELLKRANCIDGSTGNNTENGECIVDLTADLSVPGKLINGEIVIDEEAVIYCPIA